MSESQQPPPSDDSAKTSSKKSDPTERMDLPDSIPKKEDDTISSSATPGTERDLSDKTVPLANKPPTIHDLSDQTAQLSPGGEEAAQDSTIDAGVKKKQPATEPYDYSKTAAPLPIGSRFPGMK